MRISVITCTYNSEKYLDECLDSVYKQACKNYEHIIVDGYSTDKTPEIIAEYIKKNNGIKIKLIKSKAFGIANAMNIGLKNASGDIIHFLHSDDYYTNETSLRRALSYFENDKNLKWMYGIKSLKYNKFKIKLPTSAIPKGLMSLSIRKIGLNLFPHPSTFMKKELFDKFGVFNEKFKIAMDHDLWLRLLPNVPFKGVNEDFVTFRRHKNSASTNNKELIKEIKLVNKRYKQAR